MSKRIGALAAYVVMVAVNALAVTLPINGVETDEVSDRYANLFAPAGFTFSIWGVIYTLLGIYTVYQLFRTNEVIEAITIPYIVSSLLNASWILCWHYDLIWLSVLVMVGILVSLIRIVDTVHALGVTIGNGPVRYLVQRAPFSVYFGWICVATVANISAFLISLGWRGSGFSEEIWTVLTLIVAAAIGLAATTVNRDVAYGLVFVWAFFGIRSKHVAVDGWDGQYDAVIAASTVLLIVLTVGAVAALFRDVRHAVSPR